MDIMPCHFPSSITISHDIGGKWLLFQNDIHSVEKWHPHVSKTGILLTEFYYKIYIAYLRLHSQLFFFSGWNTFCIKSKSRSHCSVVAEFTAAQLFATVSACVRGFGQRGLTILFLGPGGDFDKQDWLEWYQDSEEELLIVCCLLPGHSPPACGLQSTPVCVCAHVKVWVEFAVAVVV